MIVSIHQPEHLPWIGFFDKLRQSDTFILLDNVQYQKNYFQNRNKIRTATGWQWVTVPIVRKTLMKPITDVLIEDQSDWRRSVWRALEQHYHRARFFDLHASFFRNLYGQKWNRLVDLNVTIIQWIVDQLGIKTRLVLGSSLSAKGKRSSLLLAQCKELGATVYLSGQFGRQYLAVEEFEKAGIEVRFHSFHHPVYSQVYEPFFQGMSTVDLLFNMGSESLSLIESTNR